MEKIKQVQMERQMAENKMQEMAMQVYRISSTMRSKLAEYMDSVMQKDSLEHDVSRLRLENELLRQQLNDKREIDELVRRIHLAPPTPPCLPVDEDVAGKSVLSSQHSLLRDAGYSSGIILGSEEDIELRPRLSVTLAGEEEEEEKVRESSDVGGESSSSSEQWMSPTAPRPKHLGLDEDIPGGVKVNASIRRAWSSGSLPMQRIRSFEGVLPKRKKKNRTGSRRNSTENTSETRGMDSDGDAQQTDLSGAWKRYFEESVIIDNDVEKAESSAKTHVAHLGDLEDDGLVNFGAGIMRTSSPISAYPSCKLGTNTPPLMIDDLELEDVGVVITSPTRPQAKSPRSPLSQDPLMNMEEVADNDLYRDQMGAKEDSARSEPWFLSEEYKDDDQIAAEAFPDIPSESNLLSVSDNVFPDPLSVTVYEEPMGMATTTTEEDTIQTIVPWNPISSENAALAAPLHSSGSRSPHLRRHNLRINVADHDVDEELLLPKEVENYFAKSADVVGLEEVEMTSVSPAMSPRPGLDLSDEIDPRFMDDLINEDKLNLSREHHDPAAESDDVKVEEETSVAKNQKSDEFVKDVNVGAENENASTTTHANDERTLL